MTKEEHAKVLEQTQILRDIAYHLTENGYSMTGRDIKLAALEIEAAIMRKEPEPPTVKESLTVPVVKQSLATEPISDAEIFKLADEYCAATWVEMLDEGFSFEKSDLIKFIRALLERAAIGEKAE